MGRDMRMLWRDQPRVTVKVAVYLTDVESPDDGALEVVPRSHLDTASRCPTDEQPDSSRSIPAPPDYRRRHDTSGAAPVSVSSLAGSPS